nr:MAG TPA: hypothetical protein [Caudoviricetes sp.]
MYSWKDAVIIAIYPRGVPTTPLNLLFIYINFCCIFLYIFLCFYIVFYIKIHIF